MSIETMVKKITENPKEYHEIFQEVMDWCSNNWNHFDMTDKNQLFLYELVIRELMMYKMGKWDRKDAVFMINFLARKALKLFELQDKVTVSVLEDIEFKKKNLLDIDSDAITIRNADGTFEIDYSENIIKQFLDGTSISFLRGLQTIGHEVMHAKVDTLIYRKTIKGETIPWTKEQYIIALEKLTKKVDHKFYAKNYDYLLGENWAERGGLIFAMEFLKEYNIHLYQRYDHRKVNTLLEEYIKNFYDAKMSVFGHEYEPIVILENCSSVYIEKHLEILEQCPIYQLGFDKEGRKKHILQLLEDREKMLEDGGEVQIVNDLYETIINRAIGERQDGFNKVDESELSLLEIYIRETGTEDEFVYDLIRYRLKKNLNMSLEQIEQYIKKEHDFAATIWAKKQPFVSSTKQI